MIVWLKPFFLLLVSFSCCSTCCLMKFWRAQKLAFSFCLISVTVLPELMFYSHRPLNYFCSSNVQRAYSDVLMFELLYLEILQISWATHTSLHIKCHLMLHFQAFLHIASLNTSSHSDPLYLGEHFSIFFIYIY